MTSTLSETIDMDTPDLVTGGVGALNAHVAAGLNPPPRRRKTLPRLVEASE